MRKSFKALAFPVVSPLINSQAVNAHLVACHVHELTRTYHKPTGRNTTRPPTSPLAWFLAHFTTWRQRWFLRAALKDIARGSCSQACNKTAQYALAALTPKEEEK